MRPLVCAPLLAALGLAWPLAGLAQVPTVPPGLDPGAVQQRQLDEQRRRDEEARQRIPKVQRPLDAKGAAVRAPDAATLAQRVRLNEIVFTPSRFLSVDELAALARPLVGREATLGELLNLVDRVNALYRERGIPTARALLPAQDVTDGRVQVRLVEATLGRIALQGHVTTDEGFVTERIGQQPQQVLDPRALEHDLVRFNRLYDAQLRARLEPGSAVGSTDLLVDVLEPPRLAWRVGMDNAGATSSGRERLLLGGFWRSLLGRRDEASANLSASDGTWGVSVGYSLPVSSFDTRVALQLAYDHNQITSGPFDVLNLNGHSTTSSLSLRQPVVVNDRDLLEASLAVRQRKSVNRSETVELQRTDLQDLTVGLDASRIAGPVTLSMGLSWSAVDARVTDAIGDTTDRDYSVLRASLRATWSFQPQWALRANLALQDSSDTQLPAADQFFLGGDGTVRGYSASAVGGDRGALVNLELHHPLPPAWQSERAQFSGFLFWDAGRVTPFRAASSPLPPHDRVRGAGWGLNAQFGRSVYGRVALARAFDRPQGNTLGRNVVHVQLSWQP